ncbi:hypothetical protein FQN53_001669 [Emmonsiellopsis sp. PD_33]|nr:hypothetical protein FQN53_001669 [Emmonsiellopsis sp. PD_33]
MMQKEPVRLTPSMIPTSPNFEVGDSQFFKKWTRLPSPEEVRAQAKAQHAAGVSIDNRKNLSLTGPHVRPPPVVFENLGLFVKWGTATKISEAQSLYAVGKYLQGNVPAPQIYGWRVDGAEKFIYMEYMQGQTLEQVWDTLSPDECVSICDELRTIYDNLRQLEQDPSDPILAGFLPLFLTGNVVRAPLYDRAFHVNYMSEAGPFTTVKQFHDWFTFLPRRPMPDPHSVPIEPFRQDLPDDSPIKFTHGDLHRSNIVVTRSRPYKVTAVVDWEQSGWLPAYWETRKAQYTADWKEEWSKQYLPMILDQHASTWDPWDYYTTSMGC